MKVFFSGLNACGQKRETEGIPGIVPAHDNEARATWANVQFGDGCGPRPRREPLLEEFRIGPRLEHLFTRRINDAGDHQFAIRRRCCGCGGGFGCFGLRFLVVQNFRPFSHFVFDFDDERSTLVRTNGFTGGHFASAISSRHLRRLFSGFGRIEKEFEGVVVLVLLHELEID